ncbi:hypothetical protein NX801_30060 [Streptomyces sp. LP05-1]|uniref:Uncharacterized protein n=1 Tax=Streptomyces pyxinae TaxID=2970734 RepID=A0ABT2CQU1_9ACTN|nr:hypothetical protein [Streptomyces sp. LP05-1]MCS0639807.1 hypothetical protein [Streptomyces sp. LP05-1]
MEKECRIRAAPEGQPITIVLEDGPAHPDTSDQNPDQDGVPGTGPGHPATGLTPPRAPDRLMSRGPRSRRS